MMVITPIIVVDVHHQEQLHATSYPPPKLLGCVGLSGSSGLQFVLVAQRVP